MTGARDVATVAARALLDEGHVGQALEVTGPGALGHADGCDKIAAVLGPPVRAVPADGDTPPAWPCSAPG